ncbi:class B sortase [Parablautia sp. Marseille-Q6255]|uniref:class B sortase n=1 Tax=Parablautia sp. Marseille-Q6255 TaxID=3039593 RepID=UPI0024BC9E37|nr:class B sortase [Parablautia sp. Marseille-Q6255]
MKKFLLCLAALLAVIGAGAAVFVWRERTLEEERTERFLEMRQKADLSQQDSDLGEIPVDFEELEAINPDIYAWITVPGTTIDTPVLQREGDVSYYLSHAWTGEADADGSVCSESQYNGTDFEDAHTVLYGNNCSDGTLFGSLRLFEDESFFDTHRTIAVYTPDAIRYYRIFAAYEYDSRHLLQSFDCGSPEGMDKYIKEILSQRNLYAQIDEAACTDTVVGEDTRLLTLSTGSSRGDGMTYLVQGILEKTFLR